jgi:hypothetical protein
MLGALFVVICLQHLSIGRTTFGVVVQSSQTQFPRSFYHTHPASCLSRFEHYQASLVRFLAHETFETKLLSPCADSLAK